jgi:dihydrofolate reductase
MPPREEKLHFVTLAGDANIAQQYLKAGLVDEMEIHVAPLLLGDGARLFGNTDGQQTDYECIRVVNSQRSATTNIGGGKLAARIDAVSDS